MLAPDTANQFPGPLMADLRDAFGWQLQSHAPKYADSAIFAKNLSHQNQNHKWNQWFNHEYVFYRKTTKKL